MTSPIDGLRQGAVLWALGIRVGLWLLPWSWVRRSVAWGAAASPQRARWGHATPDAIGQAVVAARRVVPRMTCLVEAMTALALLRHVGVAADAHMASSLEAPTQLHAHVWVTSGDTVVVGEGPGTHEAWGPVDLLPRERPETRRVGG